MVAVRRRGCDPDGDNTPHSTSRDAADSIANPRAAHRNMFLAACYFVAGALFSISMLRLSTIATDETVPLQGHELKKEKIKTKELLRNTLWYEKTQPILAEFPPIERRLDFIHHLEKLPSFKTGIQVGIHGILAEKTLDIWKSCTEYVLVSGYPTEPGTRDVNLQQTQERMKPKEIVEFFLMSSTDASKHLLDNHFDYIYFDTRHDYASVKEVVEHYWSKLRPGGILGGHDFERAKYAIFEFRMQQGGLDVFTSNESFQARTGYPSWWIQKPY